MATITRGRRASRSRNPRITIANAWRVPEKGNKPGKPGKLPKVKTAPPVSLADYLMQDSEFGGTNIERLADGAAHKLGFAFDAAQYAVQLQTNGSYTVIDRVLFHPPTAVYLDGIQHDIREDAAAKDLVQKNELQSMGWTVVRISYLDILADPLQAVRRVLYGF